MMIENLVAKSLANFLKANIPSLKKVIPEFPQGQKLEYPTATVFVQKPRLSNYPPQEIRSNNIGTNKIEVLMAVGQMDFTIQLDFWCGYKEERSELYNQFYQAFNKQFILYDKPMGLSLELENYHGILGRFDELGYTYVDSEGSVQNGEWRLKIELVGTFVKVDKLIRSRMTDITIESEIE
ncbi:MAG: hypothetical protein KAG18_03180 [Sinobacterium sp.]|nr:hypothetical protein [Sinobacterium sp.]